MGSTHTQIIVTLSPDCDDDDGGVDDSLGARVIQESDHIGISASGAMESISGSVVPLAMFPCSFLAIAYSELCKIFLPPSSPARYKSLLSAEKIYFA